jgi:hypothetical protein
LDAICIIYERNKKTEKEKKKRKKYMKWTWGKRFSPAKKSARGLLTQPKKVSLLLSSPR